MPLVPLRSPGKGTAPAPHPTHIAQPYWPFPPGPQIVLLSEKGNVTWEGGPNRVLDVPPLVPQGDNPNVQSIELYWGVREVSPTPKYARVSTQDCPTALLPVPRQQVTHAQHASCPRAHSMHQRFTCHAPHSLLCCSPR